jgi:2-phospho-L-lactate guanylyltransferase (CobY/MobA/RfbA family)
MGKRIVSVVMALMMIDLAKAKTRLAHLANARARLEVAESLWKEIATAVKRLTRVP